MSNVTANGIQIEYDTFGDSSFPALLLVAGNGAQMIFWDVEFCELLAKKGCFEIRFGCNGKKCVLKEHIYFIKSSI